MRQQRPAASLLGILIAIAVPAAAQTDAPAASRGELLYATHCVACHTTQLHWRDARKASDWPTLLEQVADWQRRGQLGWSRDDVSEVARFLNDRFYGFPRPEPRAGLAQPGSARAAD